VLYRGLKEKIWNFILGSRFWRR